MRLGRFSAGAEPGSVPKNAIWGRLRPWTSRQTVSGVDRIRPSGPQRAVQKVAAAIDDSADNPVEVPQRNGSTMLLLTSSRNRISAGAISTICQPGSTAKAKASRKAADSNGPT